MTDEKRSNAGQSTGPPTEHVPHPSAASQGKDRYLVLRAQDGDIDAFGKLVERYQGRLFRTAYMIVRNRHDSEDIVQETLVQAWRSLHLLRDPDAFRGWLMRICTNRPLALFVNFSAEPLTLTIQRVLRARAPYLTQRRQRPTIRHSPVR